LIKIKNKLINPVRGREGSQRASTSNGIKLPDKIPPNVGRFFSRIKLKLEMKIKLRKLTNKKEENKKMQNIIQKLNREIKKNFSFIKQIRKIKMIQVVSFILIFSFISFSYNPNLAIAADVTPPTPSAPTSTAQTLKSGATSTSTIESNEAGNIYLVKNGAVPTGAQSASANLTNLVLSGTPSNYTFSAGTYNYNGVTVPDTTSSVTVTPTGAGVITVNGVTVATGVASGSIALTAGVESAIDIVATETDKSPKIYTIRVTRAAALSIGLSYQGGKIFYLDGVGGGLIASLDNQSTFINWGCASYTVPGADGTAIGTGYQNTLDIVAAGCGGAAALARAYTGGGYSDWYLPSQDELVALYPYKVTVGGTWNGTQTTVLWSSSEHADNRYVKIVNFNNGNLSAMLKTDSSNVRAIRNISAPTTPTQATPTFSISGGAVAVGTTITITSAGADAIYYTTDGNTPTTSSTNQATTPLVINSSVTVKALAVKSGYNNAAGSAIYTTIFNWNNAVQADLDTIVSNNEAFVGKSSAVAGTPYTVDIPAGPVNGVYDIVAVDGFSNVSNPLAGWLTIDNTAPINQDTVFATSVSKQGGASTTIVSSGDTTNNVWFAPSGTVSFSAGATMTKAANGVATSILAPATAGDYKLFVLDSAGNISTASTATLKVDNTLPTSTVTAICTTGGNGCTTPGQALSPQEIYSVQSISGTATDNVGGSGIGSVKISIKDTDVSVAKWYSGTSFTDVTETYITTTGTNTWSFNSSTVPLVIDHTYLVHIKSIDSALNEESPVQALSFKFVNSPPVVSNVTASMALSGVVTVGYDVTDVESTQTTNSLFYTIGATLNGTITSGATSLTVSDATLFGASGTILIDDEMISYASKSGNILQTLTRGANSTTAFAHTTGALIYLNAASATGTGIGLSNKGTGKVITWTARTDADGYENATETIKVVANDGSAGSMIGSLASSAFIFDAKKPTAVVTFDAGSAGVVDSATITIPMPTDISAVEYLITDGASEADGTTSGWTSITTSTTIPWTFDSGIEIKNLKYQYRDAYGNTTTETITSTLSPILASSFLVQDTSNITIPSYDMYIGWKALVDTTGFSSYKLEYATSTNNVTYGSYSPVGDGMSNPVTNYYVHRNLDSTKFYRYRLGVTGTDGNTSIRAGSFTTAKPDGVQNYGEGGGGSVATASKVENVVPTQNATTKDVTVTYRLTDTSLAQKVSVSYQARVFYNIGITLPSNAYSGGNLTVSDASKLKDSGYIQINNEVIQYTGKTGNILTGLTRGTWPTAPRATRQNLTFFAGTPVWVMATTTTPTAITNTTISTGQDGSITWSTYGEPSLAGSSYTNVGIRVLVHDNQDPGVGPISSQNDYSENGILNTFDLTVPTITFDATSSTGAESVTSVNFGLTLARAYPVNSTVNYTVTGTATGGGVDYTLANGTATITAGSTTTNITATIVNDIIYESSETIIVTISSPTNAILGANTVHTYTITDNDTVSTIAFNTTSSNGLESVTAVTIPVTISAVSGADTTVDYTVTGTATGSGADYTLANGTATITAGSTTTNISLVIVDDAINELNETIIVTLSNPSGATLGTNTAHTYTITDNDTASTIAFTAATLNGLESVTAVTIPVSLSLASYQDITVNYAVTGGTATGSGTDYTLASGVATITAGQTTTNISVTVVNDSLQESSETIIVTLATPSNATLGTNTAHTYTITDDDSTPTIAFTTTSGIGAESVTPVSIGVTLSAVSGLDTTVAYTLTGTATGSGTDYTLASGTATITAGQTTTSISLVIIDDILSEVSETAILTLSSSTNSTLGVNTTYTYTITDNDTDPTVAFTAASSNGLESVTPVNLEVSIAAASSKNITVGYAVTGGTATSGVDYILASGTATITAGQTTTNISLTVINDTLKESNETVIVTLSTPSNATLGTNTAHTYTITDNDTFPTLSFNATTSQSNEDVNTVDIPVSITSIYPENVTFSYAVTSGTATGGSVDYLLENGTGTITAGQTSTNIHITVFDDEISENTETIVITISNPTNATLGANTIHAYSILDNEIAVTAASGSNIKSTSARIVWTTADYTDSTIEYGTVAPPGTEGSLPYTLSKSNSEKVLSHNIYLGNLTPSTTYYYKLTSVNLAEETTIYESEFTTTPGPIISNVTSSGATDIGVVITWTSNIPTTSYVSYSTDVDLASPTLSSVSEELVTEHTVTLTGLNSDSTYYYLVYGVDADTNVGEDANGGSYYNFATGADQTAPVITGEITTPIITATQAAILWTTNEVANGKVMYGTSADTYDDETDLISTPLLNHIAIISDLTATTKYYYVVVSADANGNTVTSDEKELTTAEVEQVIVSSGGGGGGGIIGVAQEIYNLLLAENQKYIAKFGSDTNIPVITNIKVDSITAFGAIISYETSEDTISFIEYGKDTDYGFIAADKNWSKNHIIKVKGLNLGTEYDFKISAMDRTNDFGFSDNQTFTTKFLSEDLAELKKIENIEQFQAEIEATIESILPSLVPPFIDKPVVSDITESSATVTFRTNIKSYPVLSYTTDANYDKTKTNPYDGEMSDTSEKSVSHTMSLIGLKSNTKYHVMAKAYSLPQVIGKSEDFTFITAASKIQGSIVDVKKDMFTVMWTTDEPTSSIIEYKNMKTGRISRTIDDVQNNSHSVRIENLSPGTSYQVNISGINQKGNTVESGSSLNVKTSTDNTAPEIFNLKVNSTLLSGRTDKVQTIISWQTDEPSTSSVYYEEGSGSLEKALSNKQEEVEFTKNHVVILASLKPGTVYRFTVESMDDANNVSKPPIRTIITPKKIESIVDVIFKNFNETFNFINNVR